MLDRFCGGLCKLCKLYVELNASWMVNNSPRVDLSGEDVMGRYRDEDII